jgi:competence protein ComEC
LHVTGDAHQAQESDVKAMRAIMTTGLLIAPLAAAPAAAPADTLGITVIDVEGGAAILYVTPQRHSLLIDTGWPAGMGGPRPAPGAPPPAPSPSSARRIVAAVKAAGLKRIDYLLISHYHVDHVGGAVELLSSIPVGTVIDHGANREEPPAGATPGAAASATLYPAYLAALKGHPHRVMKAGETLRIDGLSLTAINSDRQVIAKPLAGGGAPGWNCAAATTNDNLGGEENPRSLGLVLSWGNARILSGGDTTWDMENSLVCPRNLIGPIDLMFADNHGTGNANSPQLVNSVRPTVVVFGNGPSKGQDAASFDTAMASPRIKAAWQVHYATRSPEKNAPPAQIANLADGPDAMHPLRIAVAKSGAITMTNPRTGISRVYPKQN